MLCRRAGIAKMCSPYQTNCFSIGHSHFCNTAQHFKRRGFFFYKSLNMLER
jgi:hypothetical protein